MKKMIRQKGAKIRMCAACGTRFRKDEADCIRVVLPKQGVPVIDRGCNLFGRGAYVCRNEACVRKLCKTRRLSHLLRGNVPEEFYGELRREVGIDE